jgi:hypothetical protein
MVEAGTYLATVLSHAIGETQKGDPQAVITFAFTDKAGPQKITYYGSFSEKARQYTIKNLITCGLKGNNPAGDLEIGKQVEIVVEIETDDKDKNRAKVKFINDPGAARKVIAPDLAKAKLSALEGAVMAARSAMPTKQDSDDIPF